MQIKGFKAALAVAVITLGTLAAHAAEGRTPIWQPTTITTPGRYIVTRNISSPGPTVIEIASDGVDIDLNGMLLQNLGGGRIIEGAGVSHVAIRNGNLRGGGEGISLTSGSHHIIEDVVISDTALNAISLIDATNFALRRNQISDSNALGILIDAGGLPSTSGTVEGNQVQRTGEGLLLLRGSSVVIRNNRFEQQFNGFAIQVNSSFGVLIAENTTQDSVAQGIFVEGSQGCKLYNNVVLRAKQRGIELQASRDCLILDNVVSASDVSGLVIDGDRNHIERNVLNENGVSGFGWGMVLVGVENVYRGNTARGNVGGGCPGIVATPDVCDTNAVPVNTSFGDNFMPFLL